MSRNPRKKKQKIFPHRLRKRTMILRILQILWLFPPGLMMTWSLFLLPILFWVWGLLLRNWFGWKPLNVELIMLINLPLRWLPLHSKLLQFLWPQILQLPQTNFFWVNEVRLLNFLFSLFYFFYFNVIFGILYICNLWALSIKINFPSIFLCLSS